VKVKRELYVVCTTDRLKKEIIRAYCHCFGDRTEAKKFQTNVAQERSKIRSVLYHIKLDPEQLQQALGYSAEDKIEASQLINILNTQTDFNFAWLRNHFENPCDFQVLAESHVIK
jgi:hypothetical protein